MFVLVFTAALCIVNVLPVFATPDFWTTKSPSLHPTGQVSGRTAVLNGKIYAVTSGSHLEVYDPNTDTWTEKAPMPAAPNAFAVAACGNKIYVVGYGANEVYDPATDTWANKTALAYYVQDMQANVVQEKIYIIGGGQWHGFGAYGAVSSNYVYDPANDSWSEMAHIPAATAFYGSAVLDDKIYIIGGLREYQYTSTYRCFNYVQIFDPKTNSWSEGNPMPANMMGLAACATTGLMAPKRIYVIGGAAIDYAGRPAVNWTQVYDPQTQTWSNGTPMPANRSDISLANVNDKLYAMGGLNGSGNRVMGNEEYTPADYGLPAPTLTPSPSPTTSQYVGPTSSPPVPEFPTLIVLPLGTAAVTLAVLLTRRKRRTD
jgi:N-acetylneuraminic acid mutarotase